MSEWPVQDAKARFSEVLRDAEKAPQRITHHGVEKAFVVSSAEFRRLQNGVGEGKTFFEIWRAAPKVPGFKIPKRKGRMRPVNF